ncbi:hypothetical protein PR202_gb14183 [Eleusine coracana subsp. coracana]|uniref:Glutaredoxin domain-containing protein n=1 Tax=Eleusine coracana subsp. coracana TaxID=191504 RepID=A0AAV5ESA1_ELECO|nr:hypothetical protein PR202_gb14183 [Eleusine coracana subsp. coracana]
MGCATSSEARRDMVWVGANTPRTRRSFSLPSVDRQRLRTKAASMLGTLGIASSSGHHHFGSYKYATLPLSVVEEMMMKADHDHHAAEEEAAAAPFPGEEDAAAAKKQWKPRTPTLTPPNEPEVINAWELMAGLEDDGPTPRRRQSLSLDAPPPWMQVDVDAPVVALEFDPEILSGFRDALVVEDTSPEPAVVSSSAAEEKPANNKHVDDDTPVSPATKRDDTMPELTGIVRARINAFQEKIERRRSKGRDDPKAPSPPGGERRAVVYFTSLRGVRKTFVDCCAVRAVLRSYAVRLDERDVSMHAGFKAELAHLLGPSYLTGATLPRVFVDGRYLGGAEEVSRLHEAGELGRALEGCDAAPSRKLGYMEACAACGDVRFVPCETCYGSCKVFVEDDDDDVGDGYHDAGEFRRCLDCNENGLVRCPVCCC